MSAYQRWMQRVALACAIGCGVDSAAAQAGPSGQAISLPSGPGSVTGAGESFSAQLTTGTVSYTVPIVLPAARGGVQPSLNLAYSSAGAYGIAGRGWAIGVAAITRQSDHGVPRYDDRAAFHVNQDRFLFGSSELVPICTVTGASCPGVVAGEVMPAWANGWQYFRPRIEGTFFRFFWSADHRTWRVQSKDGTSLEFGVPLDGSGYAGALEANPSRATEVARWLLVRQYDSHGDVNSAGPIRPVNVAQYRYTTDGGTAYLSDVYDTPPAADPSNAALTAYAHHAHLNYAARPDPVSSYRSGWLMEQRLRLVGIDVTSKGANVAAARELLRRYKFTYAPGLHASLLASVQTEGRCGGAIVENGSGLLPVTNCPTLPALRFEYQRVATANPPLKDSAGNAFEGFVTKVEKLEQSPPFSLDNSAAGLMDVNADGLPDLVVTDPIRFQGRHGLFLNGSTTTGARGFAAAGSMRVIGAEGIDASLLTFASSKVTSLDYDVDGRADLVHMPLKTRYSVYSVIPDGAGFAWQGRGIPTASRQNVKIDFTQNAQNIRVLDVNADGVVDIVFTGPTEVQTFFGLGRYAGGDGQFGDAKWLTSSSATISNDPVRFCPPASSNVVQFNQPDVRVADMNGDGYPDIVRSRNNQILYWPGRGNGYFGTGDRRTCPAGTPAANAHVVMTNPPFLGTTSSSNVLLADVNADGLADIVEIRTTAADVYLNDNGKGFTTRYIISNTPFLTAAKRAQLTDIDGSGTPDLLWGEASNYQYVDLTGGVQPYLLKRIHNGLGRTTDIEYTSSTEMMLAAKRAGTPWKSVAPTVMPVAKRSVVRDHLEVLGRPAGIYATEYTYADAVFDGRQREFKGFRVAQTRQVGDANSPSVNERSRFLLGECSELAGATVGLCDQANRWKDNYRDALKGLPAVVEAFNDGGVYLSSKHTTYELRELYTGLDGRRVMLTVPATNDTYVYDTSPFTKAETTVNLDEVLIRLKTATANEQGPIVQRASAGTARLRSRVVQDSFGNVTQSHRDGCISGCPKGAADEVISTHTAFTRAPGDSSGWLYREQSSYVVGSVQTQRRQESATTYNSAGDALTRTAQLSGTLLLDRFHATAGAAIAPAPTGASLGTSTPVTVSLGVTTYDIFGNPLRSSGPNGDCQVVVPDADYAEFVTSTTAYVGKAGTDGCGLTPLTSTATYDRGLQVVSNVTDPQGQPGRVTYDGFGRSVAVWRANPASPGTLAPQPQETYEYRLPTDAATQPYAAVVTYTQDGINPSVNSFQASWSFVDSMGRAFATLSQADTTAGDLGSWLVSGAVDYDGKGAPKTAYDPWFFSGTPDTFPKATRPTQPATPPTRSTRTQYDAFGRVYYVLRQDGAVDGVANYHALSVDQYDTEDWVGGGTHTGTFATTAKDGHGRVVKTTARAKEGTTAVEQYMLTDYLPTGEPFKVTARRAGKTDVVRWLRYDTLGRMVLNAEPNTTKNFNPDPNTSPALIKAWRYAYDDSGQLVGSSDARGCGINYFYDAAGRPVGQDYSPCTASQAAYSVPDFATGDGLEEFVRYDTADPDSANLVDASGQRLTIDTRFLLGQATSTSDLGSKTVIQYDALGRTTGMARRIAKPGAPVASLANRYAPRWYIKDSQLDAAGRPLSASTGVTLPGLLGSDAKSRLTYAYSKRGVLKSVAGSYGTLLSKSVLDEYGQETQAVLGDLAQTQRAFTYDALRRLSTVETFRAAPSLWTSPPAGSPYVKPPAGAPPTQQLALEFGRFTYDLVGNVTQIEDLRTGADWPATAKPVNRTFTYDDFYRVTQVKNAYPGGNTWASPFASELAESNPDNVPSPHVSFTTRLTQQDYQYDWIGNPTSGTDDQLAFYDRSLGTQTHGTQATGPHRLLSATNRAASRPRQGDLIVNYDAAGNVTGLVTRRDGTCLPAGSSCWQRFDYEWDETGNLSRARRWDLQSNPNERVNNGDFTKVLPARVPDAELRYTYAGSERVLKTAVDTAGAEVHTAYVLASLELRHAEWKSPATGQPVDFEYTTETAQVLLDAGSASARLVVPKTTTPTTLATRAYRVFLQFADYLGSTSFSVDQATSELVQYSTYQAYGAAESDYRPDRWGAQREPYRFNGKEDDAELGLSYYGARYYSAELGRWLSADPVTVHELGSDFNPYSYGYNRPTAYVDPDGKLPVLAVVAIGVAVGAVIGASSSAVIQYANTGSVKWGLNGVAGAAIAGGIAGGLGGGIGAVGGFWAGVGAGAASGAAGGMTSATLSGGSPLEIMKAGAIGAVSGAIGGGAGVALSGSLGSLGSAITSSVIGGGAGLGIQAGFAAASGESMSISMKEIGVSIAVGAASAAGSHALSLGAESAKEANARGRSVEHARDPQAMANAIAARLAEAPDNRLACKGGCGWGGVEGAGSALHQNPTGRANPRVMMAMGMAMAPPPVKAAVALIQSRTVQQMADRLAAQIGKHRVTATTGNGKVIKIDLKGKAHYDKATKTKIDTPHVHEAQMHVGPNGRVSLGPETTRAATKQDIRTAQKIVEKK